MPVREKSFHWGEGKHIVELRAKFTGRGIDILLTGGENPHIGGVVLAHPRASLTGRGMSCDTWVIPVPGHKDIEALKDLAENLSRLTGQTVVASGGINISQAELWDIEQVLQNTKKAGEELIHYCLEQGIVQQQA